MAAPLLVYFSTALLLLQSSSTQATQCTPDGSPQLRLVAQLSVSGCVLFVRDTGMSAGSHFVVEPIMCVTKSLHNISPRYDPVTQQTYVSVPVTLRDDAMLAEAQRQLRHLSPKSVKFATVSNISVSSDTSAKFQVLDFIWSPEWKVGSIMMGCNCSSCNSGTTSTLGRNLFLTLEQAVLSAQIVFNGTIQQLKYRPIVQNRSLTNLDFYFERYNCLSDCQQLRFIRLIPVNNCSVRVYQRLDIKGYYLIEPLLCHNITSTMSSESVKYDYRRGKHYLELDVVLQDDMVVEAVRTQLADRSPRSVAFMRLLRAQSHVASALRRRFEVGPLMASGDGRSGQLRVYCRTDHACRNLRIAILTAPSSFWKYVKYWLTSLDSDRCILKSEAPKLPWRMQEGGEASVNSDCTSSIFETLKEKMTTLPDGRLFIKIQQRLTGTVSFQRTWTEYEEGFGDETNFWIGLKAIHSLTGSSPRNFRVEALTWSGKLFICEYTEFTVGDVSTAYRVLYSDTDNSKCNTTSNSFRYHDGRMFSTFDNDHSGSALNCSIRWNSGWWFGNCAACNPNGIYQASRIDDVKSMYWYGADKTNSLKSIRLMLQL